MKSDKLVLIDTSSWIEALRAGGREDVRQRVAGLMTKGQAAWCDLVIVELHNGARGDHERQKLSELEQEIINLPTTTAVWSQAKDLAGKCRQAGKTLPVSDIIIAACAQSHNAGLDHCDAHYELIGALEGRWQKPL